MTFRLAFIILSSILLNISYFARAADAVDEALAAEPASQLDRFDATNPAERKAHDAAVAKRVREILEGREGIQKKDAKPTTQSDK